LPGALSGIGYDYDDASGGMLRDGRIPPRAAGTVAALSAP
jgi:hypothetical protein